MQSFPGTTLDTEPQTPSPSTQHPKTGGGLHLTRVLRSVSVPARLDSLHVYTLLNSVYIYCSVVIQPIHYYCAPSPVLHSLCVVIQNLYTSALHGRQTEGSGSGARNLTRVVQSARARNPWPPPRKCSRPPRKLSMSTRLKWQCASACSLERRLGCKV